MKPLSLCQSDLEFVKSFTPVTLKTSKFYPRKKGKSRQFCQTIENRECLTHLFRTNCQYFIQFCTQLQIHASCFVKTRSLSLYTL